MWSILFISLAVVYQMSVGCPGVTVPNCERLRRGMSVVEVQRLFGGPAQSVYTQSLGLGNVEASFSIWKGKGEMSVGVWFSKEGEVVEAIWEPPGAGYIATLGTGRVPLPPVSGAKDNSK